MQFEHLWTLYQESGDPLTGLSNFLPMPQQALPQIQHVEHEVKKVWLRLKLIGQKFVQIYNGIKPVLFAQLSLVCI